MPQRMTTTRDTRLFLHLSNRLENLAGQLAADLATDRGDPMALQTVVVPSAETARWLSMQLAGRTGLAMGLRHPFLRGVVDELAAALLGGSRSCSTRYGRDAITWWLYDRLPDLLPRQPFAPVRHYLREGTASRRFELARRVASLFDQYQIYRPQLLRGWDEHPADGDWQGELWRALRSDLPGENSFIDLHAAVLELDDSQVLSATLPERLGVFGVNTLPPAFLDILYKAACRTRIDFYLLSPTAHYWSDLRTGKQQLRAGKTADETEGNPLANSLGKLNRDLLDQLLARDAQQASEHFATGPGNSLLERLQDDFCELRDRTRQTPREHIDADDASVQAHSCHGPMREVETLHDHLLGLFQDDPSLRTRDVLVMAPDIEAYAPYVRAVFGTPENDSSRIPYSLADQSARTRHGVVDAFLRVLELGLSGFEAGLVVGMLENERIRTRFGIEDLDLTRIRRWIADCGVVRGLDAAHRARFGLPASDDFSWARGLATLVLGHAMNGGDSRLDGSVLPYADLEGDHLETLDRFLAAMEFFGGVAAELQSSRSRPEWSTTLLHLAQRLFADDPRLATELRVLQHALVDLAATDPLQHGEAVPAAIVLDSLDHRLRETPVSGGFLDGRVTFCSLKPMRAIPAKVICMLGMNEDGFPRQGARLAFDLMATDPQRGDRSARDDDRCLFLEAVLGARQHLYISHVGQSQHGPTRSPPSSVVGELTDYLARGYELAAATTARLNVAQRLQAFSRHYFVPGPQRSFSYDNAAAARQLTSGQAMRRELFAQPLPEPAPEWRRLTPSQLIAFFTHPARRLCEWRLGIRIGREQEGLRAHEPLQPDPLAKYQLQQALATGLLDGTALSGAGPSESIPGIDRSRLEAAHARGQLPAGPFGLIAAHDIERTVTHFVDVVRRQIGDGTADAIHVRWQHGPWVIDGGIAGVHGGRLCRYRVASLKKKDLVSAWIEHLLVNLASPGISTRLIERDGTTHSIAPPASRAEAETLIAELLEYFWQGLTRPLPFFPETSSAYVQSVRAKKGGGSPTTGRRAARRTWEGSEFQKQTPEGADPWNVLVYGDRPPLGDEFERLALAILVPLRNSLTEQAS
jgi:exodeoxyribonuclease V gamma subunit